MSIIVDGTVLSLPRVWRDLIKAVPNETKKEVEDGSIGVC